MPVINGVKVHFKPPLPFIGNKRYFVKQICEVASLFDDGCRVFDAFGGSFFVARVIKDINRSCNVTTNDVDWMYSKRLACIEDTNRHLDMLRKSTIIYSRKSKTRKFERHLPLELYCVKKIIESAKDKQTIESFCKNMMGGSTFINRTPSFGYSIKQEDVDRYTNGIVIINEYLTKNNADFYIDNYDVIILDPPYVGVKIKTYKQGKNVNEDSIEFCKKIICSDKKCVLFEKESSPLVSLALENGFLLYHKRNPEKSKICARTR